MTCIGPGGGSGEVLFEIDAPADPADIATLRIYVNEGSGFQRVVKSPLDGSPATMGWLWLVDTSDPARWSIGAFPIPSHEVGLAMTFADAAGNESGWHAITIDVSSEVNGDCINS